MVRERRPPRLRGPRPLRRGIPLRAVAPNAVTLLALCFGLSAVRFAIAGKWELVILSVVVAGVLDGLDGRIARMLRGESRFGAELDSLSDVVAFGVSPAVVLYLWSLQFMPQFGWTVALTHAGCCALRLARFNAQIDVAEQPRKAAGYFTGIPAPAGAGTALTPLYLWLATGWEPLRAWWLVAPWTAAIALLMVSDLPTFSWSSFRLRRGVRFSALVVLLIVAGAAITAPWLTLTAVSVTYLAAIPVAARSYAAFRRRAARPLPASGSTLREPT